MASHSTAPPLFTIVTPVFNREEKLRRALTSVRDQICGDFKCLVIDDASSKPIEPVVREFDDRFIYLRTDANVGCTAARTLGYARMRGTYLAQLDSDNELFPWALARARVLLEKNPLVGGVAGLYLFDDSFLTRLGTRKLLVTPDLFASGDALPDNVAVVRRRVVDDWLSADLQYFNNDFAAWLVFHLAHDLLVVAEPWGRYDSGGVDRLSFSFSPRMVVDTLRFVERYRHALSTEVCVPLDRYLQRRWLALLRGGHVREAAVVAGWMRERGLSTTSVLRRELVHKSRRVATRALSGLVPSLASTSAGGVGAPSLSRPEGRTSELGRA